MLELIDFSVMVLACSYWKHSGYLENQGKTERDLEAGDVNCSVKAVPSVFEETYLGIMAGQEQPTF